MALDISSGEERQPKYRINNQEARGGHYVGVNSHGLELLEKEEAQEMAEKLQEAIANLPDNDEQETVDDDSQLKFPEDDDGE